MVFPLARDLAIAIHRHRLGMSSAMDKDAYAMLWLLPVVGSNDLFYISMEYEPEVVKLDIMVGCARSWRQSKISVLVLRCVGV